MTLIIMSIGLLIALCTNCYMMIYLQGKKYSNKFSKLFTFIFALLSLHIIGVLLTFIFRNTSFPLMYLDNITYFSTCYLPILLLTVGILYLKGKVNFKKIKTLLIIPTITIAILWTNDLHHLFYTQFSTNMNEMRFGSYFLLHSIYTYAIFIIALVLLITASIRNSGFFSKQTALIVCGCSLPIFVNILGTLKIISMSVYITPIMYTGTALCLSLAIIKFKALNITPVAFRTVIDTMSDAFIAISEDGTIADNNLTFDKTFGTVIKANRDENLFEMLNESKLIDVQELKKKIATSWKNNKIMVDEYHIVAPNFDKYFEVDIHPIKAKNNTMYVGTLLLFKDITQHKQDIKTIQDKQEIIVKQGQLVSIGELAGGVAHDINTPISAIKAGLQMIQEIYPPADETEKNLLIRMDNCADKIIKITNSMRNQIRNLGSDEKIKFKISDVISDVKTIAFNEIQKHKCELIVSIQEDISIIGDPTKLGQVLTNLLVNAVQAYNDKGGKVEITVVGLPDKKVSIQVKDYAGGIPDNIKEFVFKNILTTKGTKGTGLGLYLAYSVIKGEFSGEITFDSQEGAGTTFYITLNRA